MKHLKNKKGVFDQLSALAIGAVTFCVTIVIVFLIMWQIASNATVTADANASAAIDTVQGAVDDLAGWTPLIITIAVAALILGLIMVFRQRQ